MSSRRPSSERAVEHKMLVLPFHRDVDFGLHVLLLQNENRAYTDIVSSVRGKFWDLLEVFGTYDCSTFPTVNRPAFPARMMSARVSSEQTSSGRVSLYIFWSQSHMLLTGEPFSTWAWT